jgi:hypothetical protein
MDVGVSENRRRCVERQRKPSEIELPAYRHELMGTSAANTRLRRQL